MKKILGIYSSSRQHRIGEGLLARTLFSQRTLGQHVSPFVLLDHVTPGVTVAPSPSQYQARPPRRCRRLTLVQQGQVEFVDAQGNQRLLGAGDVQWCMLPAPEDKHSSVGDFRAVPARGKDAAALLQLWVDLPLQADAAAATLTPTMAVSTRTLPDGAGSLRVLAGDCQRRHGVKPASSLCDIWELQLKSRCMHQLSMAEGRTLLLVVVAGAVLINGDQTARSGEVVMLDRAGQHLYLESQADTHALLLSGEPIGAAASGSTIQ